MKILLLLALLTFANAEPRVKVGMSFKETVEVMGNPSFSYETSNESMKFGVYGWETRYLYFGAQTVNDVVSGFYQFMSREDYNEYITKK